MYSSLELIHTRKNRQHPAWVGLAHGGGGLGGWGAVGLWEGGGAEQHALQRTK